MAGRFQVDGKKTTADEDGMNPSAAAAVAI